MRLVFVCALTAIGCTFSGATSGDGDGDGDGDIDAGTATCRDWGARYFFVACSHPEWMTPQPGPDLSAASSWAIDTTLGTLTPMAGSPSSIGVALEVVDVNSQTISALVLIVNDFTLPAATTLRATGDRPLIIASYGAVTIAGALELSSDFAVDLPAPGAGAEQGCESLDATDDGEGGPGAGGGGFGATGGAGGASNSSGQGGAMGGELVADLTLRGGCSGGQGGEGDAGAGGLGGPGGGAVLVSALQAITVAGSIEADGAPGLSERANRRSGGGGGGSGGLIALESSAAISISGGLSANGGGGAGGCNNYDAACSNLADGEPGLPGIAAAGGGLGNEGGNGGEGGVLDVEDGQPGLPASRGGGGGGGGVGFVVVIAATTPAGGTVSPAITPIAPP